MTEQEKRVLNEPGVDTLMAEIATTIRNEFATEAESLRTQVYPAVGMMYLFHETNVQAISQYGFEGRTYYFGDPDTEDESMQIPACALYWKVGNGIKRFVTTEDGEYIETQPNDQGEMFTAEYHDYITYLG